MPVRNVSCSKTVFFTHSDHLGSASWITDSTGKERDRESGYDYFGARFYNFRDGFWNSVDPLADKFEVIDKHGEHVDAIRFDGKPANKHDKTGAHDLEIH